ncbi:MAG: hypothetical protein Q9160_000992 [Pyrenula sp. 1 TL-2023]
MGPLASLQPQNHKRSSSGSSSSTASAGSGLTEWLKADGYTASNDGSDTDTDLDRTSDKGTEIEKHDERSSLDSSTDDDFSSTALTSQAESILANAKKRLTNMESHLNRARSSLLVSPPFSPTNGDFRQLSGLYRSASQGGDRGWENVSRTPRTLILPSKHNSPGHSRVFSDPSVNPPTRTYGRPEFRSASAMETGYGGSIDALLHDNSPRSNHGSNKAQSPASGSSYTFNAPLKALKEDDVEKEVTPLSSVESPNTMGLGISNARSMESFRSQQSLSENSAGLVRSSSQLSTHDIRNQMNSLRHRISTLKSRTQEESLKRKGQPIARPSSSCTVAEQWYAGAPEYQEGGSPLNTNAGLGWSPTEEQRSQALRPSPALKEGPVSPRDLEEDNPVERDIQTAFAHREDQPSGQIQSKEHPTAHQHYRSDSQDLGEDILEATDEEQVYLNEALEESLHEGDEAFESPELIDAAPEPERHEDRADAFDYEHFFLHSAIGNYSSLGMHQRSGSRESTASADSVVTTRAAHVPRENEDLVTPRGSTGPNGPFATSHIRNNSVDSISTMATFQTATEGENESDDEDCDNDASDALGWGGRRPMPGSMDSSQYLPLARPTKSLQKPSRTHTITSSHSTITTAKSISNGSLPTPPITSPRSPPTSPSPHSPTYHNALTFLRGVSTGSSPSSVLPHLGSDDAELAIDLLKSLDVVCQKMADDGNGGNGRERGSHGSSYENRTFRRRLDAARRVLDGALEVDGL